MPSNVIPLSQDKRQPCSLPLRDADLSLGNANWTKGLQAMSDWIWSANLNPVAFPNNLARYFLQIPGIFEQQLNYSTTLIFDEPSFRNGIQMSGFVDRVTRELVISLIAQRRHCWYSMTHHALLGYFTAKKHGLSDADYTSKWSNLTEYEHNPELYSDVEFQALQFVDAFATDPKKYDEDKYQRLRTALWNDNEARYAAEGVWMDQLNEARRARALALTQGLDPAGVERAAAEAAQKCPSVLSKGMNNRKVDAQIVELAFLCLQFVALSDVFTGLNIPDEPFLAGIMQSLLTDPVISRINQLNALGPDGLPSLVPTPVDLPLDAILAGDVVVDPAPLKGKRIPLISYELTMAQDRDKGLTVGGVQVGVYGWSSGFHFPGGLVYALLLHPELARYEAPYSLPLLFNEDEWRNGTQTAGYVSRLLKELVFQKIYRTTRTRYGLEHHTMYLYNEYLNLHGVGRAPRPNFNPAEQQGATEAALKRAEAAVIYMLDHENAPAGVYSDVEKATLSWTFALITRPHKAYELEGRVRAELDRENRREVAAGLRRLDTSPGLGDEAAFCRLVDHQIAELAMLIGHMDGLGRAMTMLQLQSEDPVQVLQGQMDPQTGGIKPTLNAQGEVILTNYFNNRGGLLGILDALGVSKRALTVNELLLNPRLNAIVKQQLVAGPRPVVIAGSQAAETGEF
jgi:alkylhydroperoxidase family enzyme